MQRGTLLARVDELDGARRELTLERAAEATAPQADLPHGSAVLLLRPLAQVAAERGESRGALVAPATVDAHGSLALQPGAWRSLPEDDDEELVVESVSEEELSTLMELELLFELPLPFRCFDFLWAFFSFRRVSLALSLRTDLASSSHLSTVSHIAVARSQCKPGS